MTLADSGRKAPALKVLVVEDELLIGMDLVMQLEDWGYEATGPYRTVGEALREIEESKPDLAILDMNLGNGVTSMPIAEALKQKSIPFLFLTGYDPSRFSGEAMCDDVPCLRKPMMSNQLRDTLEKLASSSVGNGS